MDKDTFVEMIKDYRVAIYLVLLITSIIVIFPHPGPSGIETNLQFGLDLDGGSWIQLEFQSAVVTFKSDMSVEQFVTDLKTKLDAEVSLVDENTLEIRKGISEEELRQVFSELDTELVSYNPGVTKATAEDVKRILENKINSLGTRDAKVYVITALNGISRYVRIEMAGVSMGEAQEIVGKQGKFEIRIHTTGNETEHVLFGDAIQSVANPSQTPPNSNNWGVSFVITQSAGEDLRQAAINSGATKSPDGHNLDMILDGKVVYSAPLSPDLAAELQAKATTNLLASTGYGEEGREQAKLLEIHLRNGALPVGVTIAGSGSVSPELGDQFKFWSVLAGIFALIAVGISVYIRYREPGIVLPMVMINASEVIILLASTVFFLQLDLATIAGLIAVLGTGIDQLVIITDEILHEGKVPSPNLYMKRLKRALGIIIASAGTVLIAMLPLAVMDLSTLRGFAMITILGVLVGVLVTRPAYGRIIMSILSK
ncbi:preprotein translocase subunit SecD [Methanospirillum stamsii]|uniref:Protein-export membrane protein SecD n=1 Tax=Methanospirillum stamsii TaxID=1277351 RepID=A0A2V2MXS3_9EURY|nr:preprotein translocase subunit SecD [Methanospirillum stamsii]PWR72934.1 preprotein translocase subunit SecD [Methanospirillum stamsii]